MVERDDRLLVCRGIYENVVSGSRVLSNDPGDGSLRWLVSDTRGDAFTEIFNAANAARSRRGTDSLGFAWSEERPWNQQLAQVERQGGGRDYAALPRGILVSESNTQSVSFTAGGAAHVLTFDLNAGGYIRSWTIGGVEQLSRGAGYQRGIQVGAEWTDDYVGELVRHNPVQGGDLLSEVASGRRGSLVSGFSTYQFDSGETFVEMTVVPIEADPDGRLSYPGVRTFHGGDAGKPVFWEGVSFQVQWRFNYLGVDSLHRCFVTMTRPEAVQTGFFDAGLYLIACFDVDRFSHLRAWDHTSSTASVLSTGLSGVPGYQADGRPYWMSRSGYRGDDESSPTASVVPSGAGGVAAANAGAGDLAFLIGQRLSPDVLAETTKDHGQYPRANAWSWVQDRSGTGGPTGTSYFAIGCGAWGTNRLHAAMRRDLLPKEQQLEVFLLSGTWTSIQSTFGGIP